MKKIPRSSASKVLGEKKQTSGKTSAGGCWRKTPTSARLHFKLDDKKAGALSAQVGVHTNLHASLFLESMKKLVLPRDKVLGKKSNGWKNECEWMLVKNTNIGKGGW